MGDDLSKWEFEIPNGEFAVLVDLGDVGNGVSGTCHCVDESEAMSVSNRSSVSGHIRSKSISAEGGRVGAFDNPVLCSPPSMDM